MSRDENARNEALGLIERARRHKPIDYFGGCPHCGGNDETLNVERSHFCICRRHKVFWNVGWNLLGAWRHESEETWRANAALLETYREVRCVNEPMPPEPPSSVDDFDF